MRSVSHGRESGFLRPADIEICVGIWQILSILMDRLEEPLGLPAGTFRKLHRPELLTGSECRIIRKPAEGEAGHLAEGAHDGKKAASIGAHTDFGSCEIRYRLGLSAGG